MRSAKKWPWLKIIGCVVILLGFIPVARLYWHERSHSGPPLSFPLTLTRGEYASPSFTTDTKWSYFLVLEFGHLPRTFENLCQIGYYEECLGIEPVTFDWSFVDDKGTMLQQGRYKTHGQRLIWLATGHEEIWRVVIGDVDQYTKGQRRLVLRVLHDTPELDAFEPKLKA
jgi:hypothetical protein